MTIKSGLLELKHSDLKTDGYTMQMGSHMKNTIFKDQIASGLRRWYRRAKKNRKNRDAETGFSSRGRTRSVETTPSRGSSPLHLMRRYNAMGDIETPDISPRYYHSEYESTESPEYSGAVNQHPISKQVQTSNMEMVATFAYRRQPTITDSITESWGIKEATEQHPTSNDVNEKSRDFSFVQITN